MAKSPVDMEQKVSNETLPLPAPLVYTSSEPFSGDITEIKSRADGKLLNACIAGDVQALKRILEENNIGVNVVFGNDKTTLLMHAVLYYHKAPSGTVEFLLRERADISATNERGWTALTCALQIQNKFENANYEIARRLIEVGANVDQKDRCGHTPILDAWSCGNQEAANQLILLGANIDENEHLFNVLRARSGFGWHGCEGVPQQIALSKQHAVYLERARQLGLSIGDVCFQFMERNKRISREIGESLFDGAGMTAFNTGCEMAFQALSKQHPAPAPKKLLPIPRSLSFMPYFNSLMSQAVSNSRLPEDMVSNLCMQQQQAHYYEDWQRWQETYHNEDDTCPLRKQPGYGPGAMVVYKP